jgi:hypothetical protein
VAYLAAEKIDPWSRVSFFGAAAPLRRLEQLKPAASVWSDHAAARCFLGYLRTGWFGRVPRDCDDRMIIVPIEQEELLEVPRGFGGLIWTDRIGVIGPLAAARRR